MTASMRWRLAMPLLPMSLLSLGATLPIDPRGAPVVPRPTRIPPTDTHHSHIYSYYSA